MANSVVFICVTSLVALTQISFAVKLAPMKELNDGNKIPCIAVGILNGSMAQVVDAIDSGLKSGYRHIFTSYEYSEMFVKDGIEQAIDKSIIKKREDLFITTKLLNKMHQKDDVVLALKGSLDRLGMKYVNLFLMTPMAINRKNNTAMNIDYLETWQGMEQAKKEGLAKSIGVMDFNKTQLERLLKNCKIKPAAIATEVSPTLTEDTLVTYSQKHEIVVMAHHPTGYLFSKSKDAPPPRPDDPVLKEIMKKYKLTYPNEVLIAYSANRGLIPLPRVLNSEKISRNLDAALLKLTDAEIKKISAFNKNKRFEEYIELKNHPYYPFK